MENKEIVEYLANEICGRKIVYDGRSRYHTQNVIIAANWQTALHEIAHWIAAIPSERDNYNLGLPINVGNANTQDSFGKLLPIYKRLYSEEMVACILPLMLYDKFLLPDESLRKKYEKLESFAYEFPEIEETFEEMKVRAIELCEQYCNNIKINL